MTELTFNELAAYLEQTARLLESYDPRPIVDSLRERLVASVRENFAGEHAPDGTPWRKLKRPDHPPLVRSRDLLLAAEEAAWHSVTPEGGIAIDMTLLPDYALFQQEGTRAIPARPFIGIPDSIIDAAEESLAADVLEKMTPD